MSSNELVRVRATYENVRAICPHCDATNTYNRASDLGTTEAILRSEVSCYTCSRHFAIGGDQINAPYEMLIQDCNAMLARKQYMYCVLNLAQAHEMFFSQYLQVVLLFRPHDPEEESTEELNRVARFLFAQTKERGFAELRAIFLNFVLKGVAPANLADAEAAIHAIENHLDVPADAEIEAYGEAKTWDLLLRLKRNRVGELRNKVVHQRGYRPRLVETKAVLEETQAVLPPLGMNLDVWRSDINSYGRRA